MSSVDTLDDFDTSYWHTKDKAWVAEREQGWRHLEVLTHGIGRSKKTLAAYKRYYMKGTLPDWEKYEGLDESLLDLLFFLYLHPSRDRETLRALRDAYMSSSKIRARDVTGGVSNLSQIGYLISCNNGMVVGRLEVLERDIPHLIEDLPSLPPAGNPSKPVYYKALVLHTEGNNELLFELMRPDPTQRTFKLPGERAEVAWSAMNHNDLWTFSRWLTAALPLNAGQMDMVYQYDLPLESWYAQAANADIPRDVRFLDLMLMALYRIRHFDQAAEGDSPRTRFVRKITEMFETRTFSPAFKAAWDHVKTGDLTIKDAWNNECAVTKSSFRDQVQLEDTASGAVN